jgi:hypothetical protein
MYKSVQCFLRKLDLYNAFSTVQRELIFDSNFFININFYNPLLLAILFYSQKEGKIIRICYGRRFSNSASTFHIVFHKLSTAERWGGGGRVGAGLKYNLGKEICFSPANCIQPAGGPTLCQLFTISLRIINYFLQQFLFRALFPPPWKARAE